MSSTSILKFPEHGCGSPFLLGDLEDLGRNDHLTGEHGILSKVFARAIQEIVVIRPIQDDSIGPRTPLKPRP
jgi:hypothetical protein